MEGQEHHQMELVHTHDSGAEEWHCPTCGRRFIMKWPPAYSKIVIEPGDEEAIHSGGKGDIRIGAASVTPNDGEAAGVEYQDGGLFYSAPAAESADAENPDTLEPWLKWMRDADLDSLLT